MQDVLRGDPELDHVVEVLDGRYFGSSPSKGSSRQSRIDCHIKLDAGKQVTMMSETAKGFEVRWEMYEIINVDDDETKMSSREIAEQILFGKDICVPRGYANTTDARPPPRGVQKLHPNVDASN